MNVAVRRRMTLEEFLAWGAAQDTRHEFDGFGPVAMSGGTLVHAALCRNLAISIGGRLGGKPCQFYGSGLKVRVADRARCPDGIVICSDHPGETRIIDDPAVIFDVLRASTAQTDIGTRNREYVATVSVRRYVILEQDQIAGTMFERRNGDWIRHILRADTVLRMHEIDIAVPFAELYDGGAPAAAGPLPWREGMAEG